MHVSRCGVFVSEMIAALCLALSGATLLAQTAAPTPSWEKAAGGKMAFEVVSVKENKRGIVRDNVPTHNFSWGSTDTYEPTGGHFSAKNHTLEDYITFAYKLTRQQVLFLLHPVMPAWALDARFDIEARAPEGPEPTKDQMRLMVQSLLADRFRLQLRIVTKEGTVHALRMIQPGILGPNIRKHPDDGSCIQSQYSPKTPGPPADGLPNICMTVEGLRDKPEVIRDTGRGTPILEIAKVATLWYNDGRPVLEETGLEGTYDFTLIFSPPIDVPPPPDANAPAPPAAARVLYADEHGAFGPQLIRALKEQLGMKLETTKGPVPSVVIDHLEMPSGN